MVFYGVIGPALQHFRNISPFIAEQSVSQKENPLLGKCPFGFHDVRIKMVVPSFTALFSQPARHKLGYERPSLWPILINKSY
jgi:hypothetical protein